MGRLPKSQLFGASAIAIAALSARAEAQSAPALDGPARMATAPVASSQVRDQDDVLQSNADIVVTGFRGSLAKSLDLKRNSDTMVDAITADDIASFPEANVAESLQRIPGVSITRDNGEGQQISVRGLGGDFTRIRIDGMEALSTNGSLVSTLSTPNTSRTFDFNTFASELFGQAIVRKSASAENDEGSLGATVDLNTPRPFDYKGQKGSFNASDAYYTQGGKNLPRLSGLYSNRFLNDHVGFLVSGAFQKRDTNISNYKRATGQGDLVYRGMTWDGNEYPPRAGFAAPAGTTFNQTILTSTGFCPGVTTGARYPSGTVCTYQPGQTTPIVMPGSYTSSSVTPAIANTGMIAALTGSDPAAYAALYPASNATPGRYDDSTVIFPSLPGLAVQRLRYQRIGLTSSLQFKFSSRSMLTIDGLYSKFDQTSDQYGIEPVGLGRNNTKSTLNVASPTAANIQAAFPNGCKYNAGSSTAIAQDCGQALYGSTPLPGYASSYNPYNLDTYDYYTNPLSPGYAGTNPLAGYYPLIGRPSTKVMGVDVTNGVVDYMDLTNVDWRSQAIRVTLNTEFKQLNANFDQQFSDRFKMKLSGGWSRSVTYNQSEQVEFNALDRPEHYIYDSRGGGQMPIFKPGFDVSNPSNWSLVKGLTVMRNNITTIATTFKQGKADFAWEVNDQFRLLFGGSYKEFDYLTTAIARNLDSINPTEKEAGVATSSLGQTIGFGQGLTLPAGTPSSFFVPSMDAFNALFGVNCNCINKSGDFRLTNRRSSVIGSNFEAVEKDRGVYFQADFKNDIFDRPFSGNVGLRIVKTEVTASGLAAPYGSTVADQNKYIDYLPSMNLTYIPLRNVYVRFAAAQTMSRPSLANMAPSITAISVPSDGTSTNATISVGNTKVNPYRSSSLDFSVEWYFRPNSLLSVAVFDKEINSYPQLVNFGGYLTDYLSADAIATLAAQQASTNAQNYVLNNGPFSIRQVRDAPGGFLRGIEVNLQSDFWFLPGILKRFGFQLNGTKITSSLNYVLDPGVTSSAGVVSTQPVYAKGPWLNASPEAVNFTFYYQDKKLTARTSLAWRSDYYSTFPLAAGACSPGSAAGAALTTAPCASPLINDFGSVKGGVTVDAAVTYTPIPFLTFKLEALNITNRPDERYAYLANPQVTNYSASGTQLTFGARVKF